jgi:hypothetical protein
MPDPQPNGAPEASSSADGTSGISISSISDLVYSYINGVIEDLYEFPEIHQNALDEIVDERVAMLKSLPNIDKTTYDRIAPEVAENTRFLYSGSWDASFFKALRIKPRIENAILFLLCPILPLVTILTALVGHHVRIYNIPTVLASLVCLLALASSTWALARLLRLITRRKFTGIRTALMAAGLVWSVCFSATRGARLSTLVHQYINKIPEISPYLKGISWGVSIHNAFWIVACFVVYRVAYLMVRYIVKNRMLARVTKASSAVLFTSTVQENLLYIAYTIDQNISAKEKGDIASVSHDVRAEIISIISDVARVIESPWARSLRTGHDSTDDQTAQIGRNVAHAVLEWQSGVVFGGQNLREVRDECIQAYIKAMDGRWSSIYQGEDIQRKSLSARTRDALRKLAAIIFPATLAIIIFKVMPDSWDSYRPYIAIGAVLLTSIQIISLVDPDIVERVNTVANVVNAVHRPPKS